MDLENLPESIEYAMNGYRLNDKFTITLGKQDAAWEGSNMTSIRMRYMNTAI